MNQSYQIIPTPQQYDIKEGTGITLQKLYVDCECTDIIQIALKQFGELSFEATQKDADLVVTMDTQKYLTEKENQVFGFPNALEQGYVLRKDEAGPIIVAAKSPTGLAYGLMTLLQLTNQKVGSFSICDWPEIRYRGNKWLIWNETEVWSYDFGDGLDAFKERTVRKLNMCLQYKINMVFFDGWGADTDRTPHYKELMRYLCAEARKRGIYLIFGAYTMGYGLSAHAFGKHFGKVYKNLKNYPDGEEYECLGTYKKGRSEPYIAGRAYGTCISNNEMMDAKLDELKNFIREVQPGALYLHNMDSHVIKPLLWQSRCDACRKRWPNDDLFAADGMAGAFAEFFDRLNSGLQSVACEGYNAAEDLLIFNVSPGYMWFICDDEEIETATKFWNAVQRYSKVKKNVIPLFRELFYNKQDNRMRIPEVVAEGLDKDQHFGIINFSGGGGFYTDKLFFASSVFNYMFQGTDALITCSGSAFQEPLQVFNAEYMWNPEHSSFYNLTDRPENDEAFMKLYVDSQNGKFRPQEIFGENGMLDIICEKLYGKQGPVMSQIFKLCGKNFECVAPYACSKETKTAGNDVLIAFRWDNELSADEIETLIAQFSEIERLNQLAAKLLQAEETLPDDLEKFLSLLMLNTPLVSFWCQYLRLYAMSDAWLKQKDGDKETILQSIDALLKSVLTELKKHQETGFDCVDAMLGALARREELLEVQAYNLELMKKSLETEKRIPDDRKILHKEIWW